MTSGLITSVTTVKGLFFDRFKRSELKKYKRRAALNEGNILLNGGNEGGLRTLGVKKVKYSETIVFKR